MTTAFDLPSGISDTPESRRILAALQAYLTQPGKGASRLTIGVIAGAHGVEPWRLRHLLHAHRREARLARRGR